MYSLISTEFVDTPQFFEEGVFSLTAIMGKLSLNRTKN